MHSIILASVFLLREDDCNGRGLLEFSTEAWGAVCPEVDRLSAVVRCDRGWPRIDSIRL
jgi:hypothetical protein